MKRLIIHADDLGADEARNAGIIEAIEAGSVTAASILVNGPAFQDCLQRIASINGKQLSFGVHLNLTEGRPLSPGLETITGKDGCFYGKQQGHRRLMNRGDDALGKEIRREFAAQIQALRDAGVRMDHLDGHQHVHIFPAAIDATVRTAREFGIPWIRIPEEPPPARSMDRNNPLLNDEAERFCRLAAAVRIKLHGSTMKTTDHFRGLYLKGRLSLENLERTLQTLPPGLTELMVHPGRAHGGPVHGPFSAFSNREREKELAVLTSGSFHRMLEKYNVRLTPFPEDCP
ncbi:MAG: ChbG/HpnK family deacetylase [Syntrophales bacterium]|nr:ChbG/HpnK family deacetylase [Syntrophales bacterium]